MPRITNIKVCGNTSLPTRPAKIRLRQFGRLPLLLAASVHLTIAGSCNRSAPLAPAINAPTVTIPTSRETPTMVSIPPQDYSIPSGKIPEPFVRDEINATFDDQGKLIVLNIVSGALEVIPASICGSRRYSSCSDTLLYGKPSITLNLKQNFVAWSYKMDQKHPALLQNNNYTITPKVQVGGYWTGYGGGSLEEITNFKAAVDYLRLKFDGFPIPQNPAAEKRSNYIQTELERYASAL